MPFAYCSHETLLASLTQCLRKGDSTEADLALTALSTALVALASVERETAQEKLTEVAFAQLVPMLERLLATHTSTRVRCKVSSFVMRGMYAWYVWYTCVTLLPAACLFGSILC